MTEAESLRDFRPADNKWSVRGWHVAAIASAMLAGLLTPAWLFALTADIGMLAFVWALLATPVAALALITCAVNITLYVRFGSGFSRRGAWLAGGVVLGICVEWLAFWLWPLTETC
jgi:hypothetical protein